MRLKYEPASEPLHIYVKPQTLNHKPYTLNQVNPDQVPPGGALVDALQPYERIARTLRHAVDKCANPKHLSVSSIVDMLLYLSMRHAPISVCPYIYINGGGGR